jgi:hypothetical protein
MALKWLSAEYTPTTEIIRDRELAFCFSLYIRQAAPQTLL